MATSATEIRSGHWSVLKKFGLLDDGASRRFEPFLHVAANLCDTPIAAISFNDHTRERFIACRGCDLDRIPRAKGFSDYVLSGGCPLLVGDTRTDTRFRRAPLLDVMPDLRFYAGVPIIDSSGTALGTLAVMDHTARHLPHAKLDALQKLGEQVMLLLEAALAQRKGDRKGASEAANDPQFQSLFRSLPGYHYLVEPKKMQFVQMTDAAACVLQNEREHVLGRHVREVLERGDADSQSCAREIVACVQRVAKSGKPSKLVAVPYPGHEDENGLTETRYWNAALAPIHDAAGNVAYVIGHSVDVTELVRLRQKDDRAAEKQRVLEGQAAKLEQDIMARSKQIARLNEHLHMAQAMTNVGSWEISLNGEDPFWSDELFEILGIPVGEVAEHDDPILATVHSEDREALIAGRNDAIRTGEQVELVHRIVQHDGSIRHTRQHIRVSMGDDGKPTLLYGTLQDITHQKQVEAELHTRARQQEAVAKFGQRALMGRDFKTLLSEAVELVSSTLDVEYCKVLQLQPDGKTMKLVAGKGWKKGLVGNATIRIGRKSQAGHALQQKHSVVVSDLRNDDRFDGTELLRDHGVVSGISVIIDGKGRAWGALGAHTCHKRNFTRDDVNFFESIANILAEAAHLRRVTSEMSDRTARLSALLAISRDALSCSSRRDLQTHTAERVAKLLKMDLVAIAEHMADGSGMKPVAVFGFPQSVVGKRSVMLDRHSQGSFVLASGAPVVVEDLAADDRFEPSPLLVEHKAKSGVSLPLKGDKGPIGILGVYSTETRHLDDEEIAFLCEVAEILDDAAAADAAYLRSAPSS